MRKHIKLKIVQLAVLVGGRFILWPSWYGGRFCDWPSWYIGRFIFGRFDQTPLEHLNKACAWHFTTQQLSVDELTRIIVDLTNFDELTNIFDEWTSSLDGSTFFWRLDQLMTFTLDDKTNNQLIHHNTIIVINCSTKSLYLFIYIYVTN